MDTNTNQYPPVPEGGWLIEPFDYTRVHVGALVASSSGKWGVVVELLLSGVPYGGSARRAWVDFGTHLACFPITGASPGSDYRMVLTDPNMRKPIADPPGS